MAVGKSFFDQYSVFCVFGSVVGCVVVPLITQSVESVIFSAIVISLTATHLTRRNTMSEGPGKITKDEKKKKESQAMKKRKKGSQQHQHSPTRQVIETRPRKKRDDGVKKMEELKMLEQERKELEKKERRTKKKEEREIRKEEERVLKERELQKLQNIKEQKEKQKGKSGTTANSDKTKSLRSGTQTKKQDRVISLSKIDTLLTRQLTTDAKVRQRTSSCSDNNDEQLSPPPSVWKVPDYVPPKWNPGQPEELNISLEKYDKHIVQTHYPLNNDSEHLRPKTKPVQPFNQLYNHTTNMQANFKNQFMNQDVKRIQETCLQQNEPASLSLKECWSKADNDLYKPDNRQFCESYDTSSISQIPAMWQFLNTDYTKETSPSSKEYTLFGPEEPNRSIFTPPNLSTLGNV